MDEPSRLSIGLLGPPVVLVDGEPVAVDTRKAIALLAYLCERETAASRDELAWLLWPDSTGDRARGALRRTISSLRRALGGRWVEADRDRVVFLREDTDVDTAALDEPGGVDRVRGRFLEGFALRDAPDFDDWQAATAQHYDRIIRAELERQALDRLESGDAAGAVASAERRLSFDALDESSHRLLMTALARTGTRSRVLGFWAMRGARARISKTPKSRNSMRFPAPSSRMRLSRNAWTVFFTTMRLCLV